MNAPLPLFIRRQNRALSDATDLRETFVIALAQALHQAGAPTQTLEERMTQVGLALGLPLQCFAAPTTLQLSSGAGRTVLLRVQPADFALGRLIAVEAIAHEVVAGERNAATGLSALRAAQAQQTGLGPRATWLAFAAISAGAAILFGAGLYGAILAALLGALVGALAVFSARHPRLARVQDGVSVGPSQPVGQPVGQRLGQQPRALSRATKTKLKLETR